MVNDEIKWCCKYIDEWYKCQPLQGYKWSDSYMNTTQVEC